MRIEPDRHVRYERVAQVLAAAQRAHVTHLALAPVAN
jgi:biopolymer transport protein ExbD